MPQHDFNVADQLFPATRADINSGLLALATLSQGNTAPPAAIQYQLWLDTSSAPWVLKLFDGADWISLFTVDATVNLAGLPFTVPVTRGGTGLTSLATGNLPLGAGTSAFTALAPGASGNVATSNGSTWVSQAPSAPTSIIPSGTRMLFPGMSAAPAGWTRDVSAIYSDSVLRYSTGAISSGGADVFSTAFGPGKSTAGYALTTADLASHTHGHSLAVASSDLGAFLTAAVTRTDGNDPAGSRVYIESVTSSSTAGDHGHGLSGSISAAGSGTAHSHSLTMNLKFADALVATKD